VKDVLIAEERAPEPVRGPLEQAVVAALTTPKRLSELLVLETLPEACRHLGDALREQRLLLRPRDQWIRLLLGSTACVVLWGVAWASSALGLATGLDDASWILLVVSLPLALFAALKRRRTAQGERVLRVLAQLCNRLRERRQDMSIRDADAPLALVAGVFGLGALPGSFRARAEALLPRAPRDDSAGDDGSGCAAAGSDCAGGCGGCGG
jgi:uncharacterized protein (TIGR04222 family)